MRLLLGTAVALLVLTPGLWAGEKDPQDAAVVKKTRERLKKLKVTVDYQETALKDVIADLKQQTSLGIEIRSGKGVSANQPITYKATDKPLDVVLDQMFKPSDLGYVIGRKRHGSRYVGWILIEKGPYRGDDDEDMPDKSASMKDKKGKTKKTAKRKPPADDQPMDDAAKAEQRAEVKYQIAQELADDGKVSQAKERLDDLIKTWPNTKAAAKAKTLLKKLSQ
ncbi:MAG TPA: hypothetical protein VFA18_18630 [Gemmataceae bacterium]|nr:hypothetical protein [Gemmataceae bacterium]